MMKTPFPKSISFDRKYSRLLEIVNASEMTRDMLPKYRRAMERLIFIRDIAFVHMEKVDNPDLLVLIADFFMKIAEIQWSIVSGVYKKNLEGYEVAIL